MIKQRIEVGDMVWPAPGPMARLGVHKVLAVYDHPLQGRWLWLLNGDKRVGSFHEKYWIKEWHCVRGSHDPTLPIEIMSEMQCYDCRELVRVPSGWFAAWAQDGRPVRADGTFDVPPHACRPPEVEWNPHRPYTLQDAVATLASHEIMHDSETSHEPGDSAD